MWQSIKEGKKGMINNLLEGLKYNIKGLKLGIKTWKLLLLALLRFIILIAFTIILASLGLKYHDNLMNLIWARPESIWIVWVWHFVSWVMVMFLIGVSTILSYIISQIFFSVFIMDYMSKITELMITGQIGETKGSIFKTALYLIKQEIPRAILPIMISLFLFIIGWVTPVGPIIAAISSIITIIFLSWDNTDLVPARRFLPFKERFYMLMKNLPFHIGFGIYFLIPILNIIFFSFAPVGATMYYLESIEKKGESSQD